MKILPSEQPLFHWLQCQSSLMDKLKQYTPVVRLKVVSEYWTKASWWDTWMLLEASPTYRYRNIEIWDENAPCWFARSIFPQETFLHHGDVFSKLKDQPLGDLIHNNPRVKRTDFSYYKVDARCLEYYWLPNDHQKHPFSPFLRRREYWARFSRFTLDDAPFYLIEIFYPHLFRYHP